METTNWEAMRLEGEQNEYDRWEERRLPLAPAQCVASGWCVKGFVLPHAVRARNPQACVYSPLPPYPLYEDKAEADRVRDHFLFGPYTCRNVRVVHMTGANEDTMAALVAPFGPVTSALYGRQAMRRFFEAGVARLTDGERDILREQTQDAMPGPEDGIAGEPVYPSGACCLIDDDERPKGHVSVWAATALDDLDLEGGW